MELVNMKMDNEEKKDLMGCREIEVPEYPYGLRISLEDSALDKLGIKDIPEIGKKMSIMIEVEVSSTNSQTQQKGQSHRSVELQITDMAIENDKKDKAETLYGEK